MRLICERCGELHIDEGEFATKVHHTHSCQECGLTWRPAVVPTVGVRFLPGFRNVPSTLPAADDQEKEVCTHGTGNPLACPECTDALVMRDPIAAAAYAQNKAERQERAKWARILRDGATIKRRWATQVEGDRPAAAAINEREAVTWDCIADVIEHNNEHPCGEVPE